MPGMSPLVAALLAAVVAFLASGWWYGVHRRRLAETDAGVAAMAGMKWRECAGLVLQALGEKGYREAPASRQPGDGGTEFLLVKGDERCLLSYKHGTAYRLGEANVRDFANAVQLQGANSGILVTLGTAESFARDIARRYGVELIDGRSLWPQVEPFAPAAMVAGIREQAAGLIRRGQKIGLVASLVLGIVVFLAGSALQSVNDERTLAERSAPADAAATPTPAKGDIGTTDLTAMGEADAAIGGEGTDEAPEQAPPAPVPEQQFEDEATRAADAALRELEEVAKLTDAERNQRRLDAATRIAENKQVESAVWSTQSTLTIRMTRTDGVDDALVSSACAVLADYEEIRYSRLQLEAPAGAAVPTPVRWRVCQ
jgi:restriction system protein